jgi:hypothetical protein
MKMTAQLFERGDGYGLVRFNKATRKITFECWPRFPRADGSRQQYAGWPITVATDQNDGRKVVGYLPELVIQGARNAVVQVVEDATGEILCTVRAAGDRFRPRVYRNGTYTVKVGRDQPNGPQFRALAPKPVSDPARLEVKL